MAEHPTLLGVLSRELRENAKRSYELAVAITGGLGPFSGANRGVFLTFWMNIVEKRWVFLGFSRVFPSFEELLRGIFLIFAKFSRFHASLSKYNCGEVTMHVLEPPGWRLAASKEIDLLFDSMQNTQHILLASHTMNVYECVCIGPN